MDAVKVVIDALTTAGSHGAPTASVGQRAAQTLVADVVAECRWNAQLDFRHRGRAETARSVSLPQRYLNHCQGQKESAFEHHWPTQPRTEGDLLRVMLTLLLETMRTRGHMDKMQNPPLAAYSVDELHSKNWNTPTPLGFACWTTMSSNHQAHCLRSWLLRKFSMDPNGHRMLPVSGKRKHRNNAQWTGFEMNDAEMESLVEHVMIQYRHAVDVLHG